jgi:hypothetical protein
MDTLLSRTDNAEQLDPTFMEGSVDEYWNIFSQHVWNATSQLRNVPQTQARQCSELDRLVPCRYRLRLKLLNVPATLILLCSALVNFINSNPFLQTSWAFGDYVRSFRPLIDYVQGSESRLLEEPSRTVFLNFVLPSLNIK